MPLQNNCLRALSEALSATPIRNLEVEVGVQLHAINRVSLLVQFMTKVEESEVAEVIRKAVGKVE